MVACPTVPVGTSPGQSGWPSSAATVSACDGRLVLKLCTALGPLDTPLPRSNAMARQNRTLVVGKSVGGMKPVSLTPSELVPVMMIETKLDTALTSNRYVIAPAGPVRAEFATRRAGRALVRALFSGAI